MPRRKAVWGSVVAGVMLALGAVATAGGPQQQGNRPPGTHQDNTEGKEWIKRLERPERIPGLKIDEVIAALELKPGVVIADIGAGTGAFTIPFAKAVAPTGKALAVDIWPELLDYVAKKAEDQKVTTLKTVLAALDDPRLPRNQVDVAFFHDVFHNANDRQAYLRTLVSELKPGARIAIVEQEFDDPIAVKWDKPEDRITREQVKGWMAGVGFTLKAEFDMFEGEKNPAGTGMPARWFVVYQQQAARLPIIAGNGFVQVLVDVDGTVKSWGNPWTMDPSPGLGDGAKPGPSKSVALPTALNGVRDVVDAVVTITHVLLLKRDGTVLAWGQSGALGSGDDKDHYSPVPVAGLRNVKQIAAAENFSAAVLNDGTVWFWGGEVQSPTKVDQLTGVKQLATDGASHLALKEDGTVWGWGRNPSGGLCDGTRERRAQPVRINGIGPASFVAIEGNSTIVLADGTVRTCGSNGDGALGDPNLNVKEHLTPFQVPGITTAKSARMNSAVFIQLADGTLRGWGTGYHGALGDGRGDSITSRPAAPIGLGPVLAHYTSGNTSYAIRADGTVMAWCLPATSGPTEFVLKPAPLFTVKLAEKP